MKIDDKDDKPNTGRLHVDYAMARDDQFEYECKMRAQMRDLRHRQRLEEERLRPPSPPPVTHYSDFESAALTEKLRSKSYYNCETGISWYVVFEVMPLEEVSLS